MSDWKKAYSKGRLRKAQRNPASNLISNLDVPISYIREVAIPEQLQGLWARRQKQVKKKPLPEPPAEHPPPKPQGKDEERGRDLDPLLTAIMRLVTAPVLLEKPPEQIPVVLLKTRPPELSGKAADLWTTLKKIEDGYLAKKKPRTLLCWSPNTSPSSLLKMIIRWFPVLTKEYVGYSLKRVSPRTIDRSVKAWRDRLASPEGVTQ